jgi:exoribonuclease R
MFGHSLTAPRQWIAGTLELNSKVRYGLTSRGVPLFRFVPYDARLKPLAVGCSQRNLFYNVHAIVEPSAPSAPTGLQKGTLVKNLGKPTPETFAEILKQAYVYDNLKPSAEPASEPLTGPSRERRHHLRGTTFHIDPPGCRDVDDSFTIHEQYDGCVEFSINIADVATAINGSTLSTEACQRATSFYTPNGEVVQPMFPSWVSEEHCSLLPGSPKLTVSLCFTLTPDTKITDLRWELTTTTTTLSYTYEQADRSTQVPHIKALARVAEACGAPPACSSHDWVAFLMIFYNKEAAKLLAKNKVGILRRHAPGKHETISKILANAGVPEHILFQSAEYCLPTDENTFHFGLAAEAYAYATSPIRRYADFVNQQTLIAILKGGTANPTEEKLVKELNRREKQAKAFQRDYFYMTTLTQDTTKSVLGTVIEYKPETKKLKVWVPEWNRIISVKNAITLEPGARVAIQWYMNPEEPRWKEKVVFRVSS